MRATLAALAVRLQAEYEPTFEKAGAIITIGATSQGLAAEILWDRTGLYTIVRVERRQYRFFGPVRQIRTIEEAESDMRRTLARWLSERPWATSTSGTPR